MSSRATASAGRGPTRLPASAPARTAARSGLVRLHEVTATVLLPASLGVLQAERLFLAVADGAQPVRGDAERYEELLHGAGAAVAEAEVVFRRTTLIAVAFDGYLEPRILFQEIRGCRERGAGVWTNISLVEVEIGIAHFSQEEFVVRGPCWRRRRWRWRIHGDGGGGARRTAGTCGGDGVGRRIGGRDLCRTLGRDGTDFRSDGKFGGVRGVPAQGRGLALVDCSGAGLQRHCGTRGGRCGRRGCGWWRDGLLGATKGEDSGGERRDQAGAIERA